MTDRPEPGYYWARLKHSKTGELFDWEVIYISYDPSYHNGEKPMVEVLGSETGEAFEYFRDLVGPLQPPEGDENG